MGTDTSPMGCNRPCTEGIEIGAVSVKWVRRQEDGSAAGVVRRHEGNPSKTVEEILRRSGPPPVARIAAVGPTARRLLNLPYFSETECIERALSVLGSKPDLLLSLGGETFSLYTLKDGVIKNIVSSSKCAAGTGEFIVQQLRRLNMSLEDGIAASLNGRDVGLATRCSVHCKSDTTHKLNKGECTPADIVHSLFSDLAKKVFRMIECAQWPTGRVAVAGGVGQNAPFLAKLEALLGDSKLLTFEQGPYLEAFGAAHCALDLPQSARSLQEEAWLRPVLTFFDVLKPLEEARGLLDYRVKPKEEQRVSPGSDYVLGVDAGSTTTKAVLFNLQTGLVDASCYLRTHGNPIVATKECLHDLRAQLGDHAVRIVQLGVTGSGREMVSAYLGNCSSLNEILAHARAATEESPDVDTVFEIGGQDSKFISFLGGIPVDYAMNEGCSAGTGSFLEESASLDMQVPVREISEVAGRSSQPLAFGERCAAFINTDLRDALQQGAEPRDVLAGLVCSIAQNYISRIVGSRAVGNHVLFQGGVALNQSVALALAAKTGKRIIVPPHPELMGAVGTALMIRDRLARGELRPGEHRLEELASGEIEARGTFRCASCGNQCEVQRIAIRDKMYPFGGLCSKFENQRHRTERLKEGCDLVALRASLMLDKFGPQPVQSARGKIGLPMALTAWELFPFYAKLINELGYDVILSEPCKEGNDKTAATVCYPCQIAHGAVFDLREKGVDYIFLPHVIELDVPDGFAHGYTCPTTTVIPDLVRKQFSTISGKFLSPHIALREDRLQTTIQEIATMAGVLGIGRVDAARACKRALSHYQAFRSEYRMAGAAWLERLTAEPTVILAGRPYTTCAPEANLALPRKIVSRGYHVIPADMLPPLAQAVLPRNGWAFTQQVMNAVAYARTRPNLYVCLLTCFSCGPDASVYHLARQELAGRTFCYLEVDSHTAHAGIETRVGAFLDVIEERRRAASSSSRKAFEEIGGSYAAC